MSPIIIILEDPKAEQLYPSGSSLIQAGICKCNGKIANDIYCTTDCI